MAFKAANLGMHVSSTGKGGFLTYFSKDDAAATIDDADFWNKDESDVDDDFTRDDLAALKAAESFVRNQSDDPQNDTANLGGVPIHIVGNEAANAYIIRRARLAHNARSTAAERKAYGKIIVIPV